MLFRYADLQNRRDKRMLGIIIVLSVCISVGLFGYLVLKGPINMVYSKEEFYETMRSRGAEDVDYIESILYRETQNSAEIRKYLMEHYRLYDDTASGTFSFQAFLNMILIYFCTSLGGFGDFHFNSVGISFLTILPVFVIIFDYMQKEIRDKNRNGLKRFACFCSIFLFFFTTIVSLFTASGHVRWLSFSFLPMFIFFLYSIFTEKTSVLLYLQEKISVVPKGILLIYLILYMVTVPGIFAR